MGEYLHLGYCTWNLWWSVPTCQNKKERTQPIHQLFQKQRNINLVDPTTTQHQWAKQTHPGNSFSNAWFILKMAIYIYTYIYIYIYIWKLTILLTFGHSFHLHEYGSKIQPGVKDSKKEKKCSHVLFCRFTHKRLPKKSQNLCPKSICHLLHRSIPHIRHNVTKVLGVWEGASLKSKPGDAYAPPKSRLPKRKPKIVFLCHQFSGASC